MARIRTVKPEYWTDDRVGECSVSARLLFIASWNFADDAGGLDRSAKQLKAQAFPYDQVDCERFIQELLKVGLLIEYEAEGKKYLHIKGFRRHQKIEKPAKPRYPVYEESLRTQGVVGEESVSSAVSSLEGNGREGNGRDRGGGLGEMRAARAPVAQRLPDDFELSPERRAIAETERINPDREFAKFRDHWRASSGANARKRDWDAAWRNWCRRASEMPGAKKPRAPSITLAEAEEREAQRLGITVRELRIREGVAP